MDKDFSFIVKEEILRNILRTHSVVLLLGWTGTGKTASSVRASRGIWKTCYLNAAGHTLGEDLLRLNEEVAILSSLSDIPTDASSEYLVIIDDFDGAPEEVIRSVKKMISEKEFPGKILISAQAQPRLEEAGLEVDAVVRLKESTAQVLYTRLRELP